MKYLFFLSLTTTLAIAAPENSNSKEIKIEAQGLGTIRIFNEDIGEPIAAPARVTVSVKCKDTGDIKQVALFRLCKFESYSFERETKILSLKMISGRVVHHSGEVVCDQVDHKSVDLMSSCSEAKLKEP